MGEVKRAPAVTVHFKGEPIALKGNPGREDSP